jgi:hypothetical protein
MSIPPSITAGQIRDFTTATTKEVLGGGMS